MCKQPIAGSNVSFRLVAETQGAAILVTSPPNDIRRFVVEQEGRIKLLEDTGLMPTPFLDISNDDTFACCGERGLLGLAFHPQFATNHTFFIFYTTADANILARYKVSATNPDLADPASREILVSIPDFAGNHNGGMLDFGPDGKLYFGTGDGGGGGDPMHNGQNTTAQLGKLLRLDVDTAGAVPEAYLIGMRNPWRFAFDRMTHDLWIGDVGQDEVEELDMIPASTKGPLNLGWNMYEGTKCYEPPCDATDKTMPVFEETHANGWCSIIGGDVYRGGCYPDLVGTYFFTDYCKHQLYTATKTGSTVTVSPSIDAPPTPSSLHADARGELFLTTTTANGSDLRGGVYQLEVH